ncbi:MAG: ATP-binding cassette domain-containing protein [Mesorhizobium sp.]
MSSSSSPASTPSAAPLLEAVGLSKSFGPVEVLKDISLDVRAGEVHAIIGENGAGKSTLMKLLAGHLQPSKGELRIDGQTVTLTGPVDAERRGIVLVHQEILLAPDLTVAQNVYLGRELGKGLTVDDRAMNEGARRAVRDLGADIDPNAVVGRLSIAQRQLVQIARVLLVPHRVVIFDEPTASLTPIETEALLKVIADIRARGTAVLYISHRLPEVKQIADRVTVLRDGRLVASRPAVELEPMDMAKLMVGRDVAKLYPDHQAASARETVLEVEDFSVPGFARHASFRLGKGEILGFAGLVGAGRTELMEGIVGLRPGRGTVRLNGQPVHFANVDASLKAGIVYLSEDRKGKGLLLTKDLRTNLTLASLAAFVRGLQIDRAREAAALDKAIAEFDIRTGRKDLLAGQLSGGNQQKLLLAKMMMLDPAIVIIDEPTRGIDIGTKEQIYKFIARLADEGRSIIVISSEMPELIGICDRVLVMRAGGIVGEVAGDEMTEDRIVVLAILLGAACGLANGLITTLGGIEPFIATLGTMGIFRGLTTWLSQGGAITLRSSEIQSLYRPAYFGSVLGVPVPIIVILATAALGAFVLYRTRYGRHVLAVGSNEDVARYSGIPVSRVRTLTYVIQGLCVAVACLLYIPRLGSTSATTGLMWELQAITAVVVGGTALRGGVGRIWGTICGAFILEIVGNIMLLSNFVSEYLLGAIQGAIIIIAMLVQRSLARR